MRLGTGIRGIFSRKCLRCDNRFKISFPNMTFEIELRMLRMGGSRWICLSEGIC